MSDKSTNTDQYLLLSAARVVGAKIRGFLWIRQPAVSSLRQWLKAEGPRQSMAGYARLDQPCHRPVLTQIDKRFINMMCVLTDALPNDHCRQFTTVYFQRHRLVIKVKPAGLRPPWTIPVNEVTVTPRPAYVSAWVMLSGQCVCVWGGGGCVRACVSVCVCDSGELTNAARRITLY